MTDSDWAIEWTRRMVGKLKAVSTESYREASPFPHCVIDGFLDPADAAMVADSFPTLTAKAWKRHIHANSQKFDCNDRKTMGPVACDLIDAINSLPIVLEISRLVGSDVMSDGTALEGGGIHHIPRGGFVGVHADFNVHPNGLWMRAANLLLYLNRSQGGDLELWKPDASKVSRVIETVPGRAVLFTTTDGSLNGHPSPLASDSRKSIETYYYIPKPEGVQPHTTLYKAVKR